MSQLSLFPEPKKIPDLFEQVPHKKVYVKEKVSCDLAHMSECAGNLYWNGSSLYRCARHITLQTVWVRAYGDIDLIDWIKEEGDEMIDDNLFAVGRSWKEVS